MGNHGITKLAKTQDADFCTCLVNLVKCFLVLCISRGLAAMLFAEPHYMCTVILKSFIKAQGRALVVDEKVFLELDY